MAKVKVSTPRRLYAGVLLLTGSSFIGVLPARADVSLAPIGGEGGGAFTERCAAGHILHGLELTVGDSVDSVRPVCASILPGGQATNDAAQGTRHGGANRLLQIACPIALPAILSMEVRYGGAGQHPLTVYAIQLHCGRASSGAQTPSRQPGAEFNGLEPSGSNSLFHTVFAIVGNEGQFCPKGQVAVGVNGRSGALLDAIGLVCGESPRR